MSAVRAIPDPLVATWKKKNPLRKWLAHHPRGTYSKLAEKMGLKRQALDAWLAGRASPNLQNFLDLSRRTGITLEEWVRWENAAPESVAHQRKKLRSF